MRTSSLAGSVLAGYLANNHKYNTQTNHNFLFAVFMFSSVFVCICIVRYCFDCFAICFSSDCICVLIYIYTHILVFFLSVETFGINIFIVLVEALSSGLICLKMCCLKFVLIGVNMYFVNKQ